ncbi:CoA-binding protein [Penaeicola halotolerans]|uniref:CoA-binding protein n=1 Tax=Penaeicola halotolerans TaxID=2793196 RepID=UPI001CF88441|nr:CoA-binding protein [Penaeicola halotolerans]
MKTVIIGASTNPDRYAYKAAHMLKQHKQHFVPVGIKSGEVAGEEIVDLRTKPAISEVDTVTLYLGPQNQPEWESYILSLKPRRVVFNPGTENPSFQKKLTDQGVIAEEACTLVLLSTGQY